MAQDVDGDHFAIAFEAPVGPAVAAWGAFEMGSDLVDGSFNVVADQGAVRTHLGFVALVERDKFLTRAQHAAFDQLSEGDTWFRPFGG